jgi:uncharacterized protein (TIGR00251 family)
MTFDPATPIPVDSFLREHPEGCSAAIRVQPGAKRTAITGIYSGASRPYLNIALQAPPVEGKANDALVAFLAKLLSVPRSRIAIIHGEHDRFKLIVVGGLRIADVQAVVQEKLQGIV